MLFQLSEGTASLRRFYFALALSDGSAPATGQSITGAELQFTKAGGTTLTNFAGSAPTELSGSDGIYMYEFTAGELDTMGVILAKVEKTGVRTLIMQVGEVVGFDPYDAVRMGMTALPNANAEAAGGLFTRGTGAGQINQNANGQVDTRTVTMAADVVTASAIATDAIGSAEIAAAGATKIAAAVWDEARAGHVTAGSFGQGVASVQGNVTGSVASVTGAVGSVTGAVGSVTGAVGSIASNGIAAASIATGAITAAKFAAGAIDAAAIASNAIANAKIATGAISAAKFAADAIDSTVLAASAITAAKIATDAITTAKIADGAITNAKVADGIISAAKFATDAISATAVSAAAATKVAAAVLDEPVSGHVTAGTLGELLGYATGSVVTNGSNTALTFQTNLTQTEVDHWKDCLLVFRTGALTGQVKKVDAFNPTTDFITVLDGYTTAPANGDAFFLINK